MSETQISPEIEPDEVTPQQRALRHVLDQIEMTTSSIGWDRPPALYALVPTAKLLDADDVPADVVESLRSDWDGTPTHLSAVAQDTLSEETLEEMLPRIQWPDSVEGAALTIERIVLPHGTENDAPSDPDEAAAFAESHPERTDIRVTVGVNRAGDSWCEVRAREFDDRDNVGQGQNLVPGLVEGLRLGFADLPATE